MTAKIQHFQALAHQWEQTRETEKMKNYRNAKNDLYRSYQHFRATQSHKVDLHLYHISMDTPISWVIIRKFETWDQFCPKEDEKAWHLEKSLEKFVSAYTDSTEDRMKENEAKIALGRKVKDLFASYSGLKLSKYIDNPHTMTKIGKWERQQSPDWAEQLSNTESGQQHAAAIASVMGSPMATQGIWGRG